MTRFVEIQDKVQDPRGGDIVLKAFHFLKCIILEFLEIKNLSNSLLILQDKHKNLLMYVIFPKDRDHSMIIDAFNQYLLSSLDYWTALLKEKV